MSEGARRRRALVTGASRGIGLAIARALARGGWDLVLVARDRERLAHAAAELRRVDARGEAGARTVETVAVDLARPDAAEIIIDAVRGGGDRLDALIHNAGRVAHGPIDSYDAATWDAVMAVNARTPFLLTGRAVPLLEAAEDGRVIVIGSVVSRTGYADQALYTASKHALLGMAKAAARDLAPRGIVVQAVLPGGVDTDMVREVRPDIDATELVRPEEVADAVIFLLNQRGNAITDQIEIRRRTKQPFA